MSHQRSTATTRRPASLRWAAIVYVVVVLLGVAATGAQAYWSQSGTVVANVTTGTWGPQEVTGVKCSAEQDGLAFTDTLFVDFVSPADADLVTVVVDSQVQRVKATATGKHRATFTVKNQWLIGNSFDLKVTPEFTGTGATGKPVLRTVKIRTGFNNRISATCSS